MGMVTVPPPRIVMKIKEDDACETLDTGVVTQMLNKCLLWSLSREGRSVKEGRRGVRKCGDRDRKGS